MRHRRRRYRSPVVMELWSNSWSWKAILRQATLGHATVCISTRKDSSRFRTTETEDVIGGWRTRIVLSKWNGRGSNRSHRFQMPPYAYRSLHPIVSILPDRGVTAMVEIVTAAVGVERRYTDGTSKQYAVAMP